MRSSKRSSYALLAAVGLGFGIAGFAPSADAATMLWTGGSGSSNNWSAAANWSVTAGTDADGAPDGDDDLQFYQSGAARLTTNTANVSVLSVTYLSTSTTQVTTAGTGLTVGAGGLTVQSGAAGHTISAPITLAGTSPNVWTISNAAGYSTTGNFTSNSNTRSLTKAGNGALTLGGGSGTVDLRGGVTVSAGDLNLAGAPVNSYFLPTSGNSNVSIASGGKIDMRGGNGEINGTLTGAGEFTSTSLTTRALTLSRGTGYTLDTLLSGNLAITKNGGAVTTFSNANTYTGGTTLNAGRVLAGNATGSALGTGDAVINGGGLGGSGFVGTSGDAVNVTFGANGGLIEPGTSSVANKLTLFGNLDFTSAGDANFAVKLNGLAPGAGGYDQLEQTGALNLSAGVADLLASMNLVADPANGTAFVIVNRPGSQSAATGAFEGLPTTGSPLTVTNLGTANPITMYINYAYNSGDGNANDVALVVGTYVIPEPASLGLVALGGLMTLRRRAH